MDYTLLTAVHPLTTAQAKLTARQEQEYYESAAARQVLQEMPLVILHRIWSLATTFMAQTIATGRSFGHGLTSRKALH